MTADIIHTGHIACLRWLVDYKGQKHPDIVVGLLTDKALKGYKKPVMNYKERETILKTIANGIRDKYDCHAIRVVPQNSLDPSISINRYQPVAIASGDGFEPIELKAIKKYKLLKINIRLPRLNSSSGVKEKICKEF